MVKKARARRNKNKTLKIVLIAVVILIVLYVAIAVIKPAIEKKGPLYSGSPTDMCCQIEHKELVARGSSTFECYLGITKDECEEKVRNPERTSYSFYSGQEYECLSLSSGNVCQEKYWYRPTPLPS